MDSGRASAAICAEFGTAREPGTRRNRSYPTGIAFSSGSSPVDDADARTAAKRRGLLVVGVVGVLLAAKNVGVIAEITGDLNRLVATTFRISSRLYRDTLVRAGEL